MENTPIKRSMRKNRKAEKIELVFDYIDLEIMARGARTQEDFECLIAWTKQIAENVERFRAHLAILGADAIDVTNKDLEDYVN